MFVENQGNRHFYVEPEADANANNQQHTVPQVAAVAALPRTPTPPLEGDANAFDFFNPEEDWDSLIFFHAMFFN